MINRQQSRNADRFAIDHLKIPGIVLMENAGRGCAEKLLALGTGDGVVVCCGSGNNGGDGFVIARHLFNAGVSVKVVLFAAPESYSGDALTNLRIIEQLKIRIVQFDPDWSDDPIRRQFHQLGRYTPTWIVDAILGTGSTGPLRPPLDRVVKQINASTLRRMAIDVPTGLDCDSGEVATDAVRADITCALIDSKTGFSNPQAPPFLGHVTVVGIGASANTIVRDENP